MVLIIYRPDTQLLMTIDVYKRQLLDMVDEKKIALNPAYELSFLKKEEQVDLLDAMDSEQATPSPVSYTHLNQGGPEGAMISNCWLTISGKTYFINQSGVMTVSYTHLTSSGL